MAKLSGADIVAIEGMYHFGCLNKNRNKHREQNSLDELDDQHWEARSFAELISYLENCIENESYIFKLRELCIQDDCTSLAFICIHIGQD